MSPIFNAKDRPLNANTGGLPNVGDTLQGYFQPMIFTQVTKTVVDFVAVETPTNFTFMGVWQPYSPRQLLMRPEGERKWKWFICHAEPGVPLDPDEVITYLGEQYRIMEQTDYTLYGYIEYHLINDYTGSGPNE